MKDGIRKSNDGIKRLKKSQRTRIQARSFGVPSSHVNLTNPLPKKVAKQKKRKTSGGIKKPLKKFKTPVLGDYNRPGIPELTLKKSFYTTPKRAVSRTSFSQRLLFFISTNKKKVGFLGRFFGVGIFLLIVLNQSPKAFVSIDPHLEYQNINIELTAQKNPKLGELGFDIIAVTDEESLPIIAENERQVEKRAQGEITIFNNFSNEPQRLLSETRFKSASGKIFKLAKGELLIPGKDDSGPGTINATIYAQEPGEEYNLDITDFTIPGFRESGLDDKYNGIYAVSTSSFSGGFIGVESYISTEKKRESEIELREKLKERLKLRLLSEKTDQVILVSDSTHIEYKPLETIFSDQGTSGVISQRGIIIAVVVSKEKLSEYLTNKHINVPEGESAKVINVEDIKIFVKNIDTELEYDKKRTAQLKIVGDVLVSWDINNELLVLDLLGKNKNELIPYFGSKNSIDRATVKTRPFWKNRLPKSLDSITVSKN